MPTTDAIAHALHQPEQRQQREQQQQDYRRIQQAIEYLSAQRLAHPSLADLAGHLALSEHHLQRLFTRWAGVSPKRFLQFLTKEHAKQLLRQHTLEHTSLTLGLSGTSRLHDLMVHCESVTPGEYKRLGQGMCIQWGLEATPFGLALMGVAPKGLCHLVFVDGEEDAAQAVQALQQEWPHADLVQDQTETAHWADRVFGALDIQAPLDQPLPILLKGSPFQLKVWEALLRWPSGQLCAYQDVAEAIGKPRATRAVASAIARNQIAVLIPCHRVIRSTGDISEYRWGRGRKRTLIAWESARQAIAQEPTP
jgi:AraC family transcriptional regulator of adaptative response/methylated-DNA-[protein]-cysteine methyltransferase